MSKLFLIIFLTIIIKTCLGARILCLFIVPSYSHQQFFLPICKELSLRGHQVVVVTSHPINDSALVNLTEIDVSHTISFYNGDDGKMQEVMACKGRWDYEIVMNALNLIGDVTELIFEDKNFKRIYQNPKEHFDLLIVQNIVPTFYSFGARFNAPIIGITSMEGMLNVHENMGNLYIQSLYGHVFLYPYDMSVTGRFLGVCYYLWFQFFYYWQLLPKEDERARKYLGEHLPYLGDMEKNVSMQFLNGNFLTTSIKPIVPNVKYLSQMHIKPPKQLPNDIQTILDEAQHGVVYFSLGSNVRSSDIDKNLLKIVIQDLSELPYTVLWKWEVDDFPSKPKNVITRKWFPQQDLLAHPNVKVFVCQGGLQSLEEAVIRAVPIVVMPFIVDQPQNANKVIGVGVGLKVDPNNIRRNQLKEAILEVAQNDKYKENIENIRKIALDQPMTGLETAVWWSEYVIRYKGTRHLRSPTADIPLYEYLYFDVVILLFLSVYYVIFNVRLLNKTQKLKIYPKK